MWFPDQFTRVLINSTDLEINNQLQYIVALINIELELVISGEQTQNRASEPHSSNLGSSSLESKPKTGLVNHTPQI